MSSTMADGAETAGTNHRSLFAVEDFGCTTPIYFSLPSLFLYYLPLVVLALVVCGYSGEFLVLGATFVHI